jgi:AhpD family alkylhydroperoxidase
MTTVRLIEYDEAVSEVKAVYDEIMAARGTDSVNNFWKALAVHPPTLRRTWDAVQAVMTPGALDARTKEMLYLAVSIANNCEYCIHSHTASARRAGMTDAMYGELLAVVGMASETNSFANATRVPVDPRFQIE